MANQKRYISKALIGQGIANQAQVGTSLNSAMVFGTSGAGFAVRYFAPVASPIANVYVFMYSSGGTIANIAMACEMRNERSSGTSAYLWPGTTTRETASGVTVPNANLKWIKATFGGGSPYTPAIGEPLWFVFSNTAGAPATDFPSIMTQAGVAQTTQMIRNTLQAVTTANGFNTTGVAANSAVVVVEHDDGTVVGWPWTSYTTTYYTNNTRERGIVIGPLDGGLNICGWNTGNNPNLSAFVDLHFYATSTAPGGTPLYTEHLDTDTNNVMSDRYGTKLFAADWVLAANTSYYSTVTFGSNAQYPAVVKIDDYSSYASVFDKCYDGVNFCYSVIDDGAGGWTLDKSVMPDYALAVSYIPAGGGGGPLIGPGRLVRAA